MEVVGDFVQVAVSYLLLAVAVPFFLGLAVGFVLRDRLDGDLSEAVDGEAQ